MKQSLLKTHLKFQTNEMEYLSNGSEVFRTWCGALDAGEFFQGKIQVYVSENEICTSIIEEKISDKIKELVNFRIIYLSLLTQGTSLLLTYNLFKLF